MKTIPLPCLWISALLIALSFSFARSQEKAAKPADPYAFTTRVYRMPSAELSIGFVSKERGKLRAPELPGSSAGNGEIEAFIKRSHDVVKEYLAQQGIALPKGSLACYDPATGTLALRAMNVVHEVVQPLAESLLNQMPTQVAWALEILETKSPSARTAVKEATGQADHTSVYDHLQPQSKIVVTMRGETKSGQQSTANQSARTDDATEYTLDDKNRVDAALEPRESGTKLELEPTVGVDGQTIDLNIALTHRHSAGTARWDALTASRPEKIEARWFDHPLAAVKTSLTMRSGATKMLGVWALDGSTAPESADLVRVAFVRVAIVKVQPLDDGRVAAMLKSRGEAVDATPKAVRPIADPNLPPGMIVRRFRVPPDFLSAGGSPSPADPFAAPAGGAAPPSEPRFTRRITVEEILRSLGIPFPDGASANYLPGTSELVVRNTPANVDLVAGYVQSTMMQSPKTLGFTVHIVQADAATLRKLERDSFAIADHSAAWKAIEDAAAQGKARILRSAWLESKSGQQCTMESVVEYTRSTGAEASSGTSTSETKKSAGGDDGKSAPVANASVTNNAGTHYLSTGSETTPVGLRFEIEPTLGADGWTIDVNISTQYDYAPPVQQAADEPAPERTVRLAVPQTAFRKHEFKTSTTMREGSTRLISIWKPSGTTELDGDVLQAAFLRADVVPVTTEAK